MKLIPFIFVSLSSLVNAQESISIDKVIGNFSSNITEVHVYKDHNKCQIIFGKNQSITSVDTCDITLINEQDLNNDGYDDLTVVSAPSNGCTYNAITYSFATAKTKILVPLFMVETECEPLTNNQLQSLVGTQNHKIFHLETDVNDENFRKVKVFNN
jgi:hypothetical protein